MTAAERIARDVQDYLGLSHRPVGIQIKEATRSTEPSRSPRRFCILEREDLSGGARTFRLGDVECPGPSLALGLAEPTYTDVKPRIQTPVSSVQVGPIEGADQVLFTVTPRQPMTLAVLVGGIEPHCRGVHAVCGEVIAPVHGSRRPRLSLLCLGMRDLCGFRDDELVVGLSRDDYLALPDAMARHASLRQRAGGAE